MAKAWVGEYWRDILPGMRLILGDVAVEWPGDTPRPESARPRVILDGEGIVARVAMPRSPRYAFETPLGPRENIMRTPGQVSAMSRTANP